MTVNIPLETFSKLVEAIYASALNPAQWTTVGQLLAEATGSLLAGVGILDASTSQFEQVYGYGIPEGYFERYAETVPLNPLLPYATLGQPGDFVVNSAIISEAEQMETPFYEAFMKPLGLRDSMILVCLRSGPRVAFLAINRAIGQPLYGEAEQDLLRLLSPHICRAFTICDVFDLRAVKTEGLEAALDGLTAGVFLIDAHGQVLHMNRAAEGMAQSGRSVMVRDGQLWPVNATSRGTLSATFVRGSTFGLSRATEESAIALETEDGGGTGMMATLLPLGRPIAWAERAPYAAAWAVFVQDPRVATPLPGEAFGRLYRLTPAELRVALALAPGLTPEQAATMLGLSPATVRSHVQRIFTKTGTNRQADLVRLMMATMPPVAAPGRFVV
jgi:DNA-binding CsgD family transcriptional regulator/PAS domain-containing protein